jgi:two-component system sensor kinase FixL
MRFFDNLSSLCSTGDFMPHGYCYLWKHNLVLLHVVSDSLIGLAYILIPCTLLYFIRKRTDLPFNWIFVCFGLFIIACGSTHIVEVWTVWSPIYWLSGYVKAFTAGISLLTAFLLLRLVPKALALPSPEMLHAANAALQNEIKVREQVEQALRTSEQHMRMILATASDAFVAVDRQDLIVDWNHQAEVIFGWQYQEVINKPLTTIIIPERYRKQHQLGVSCFMQTVNADSSNRRMELTAIRRDGSEFAVEVIVWVTKLGDTYQCNALVHDISERKLMEKLTRQHQLKIEQAARVNSVGELTIALAHELNQPLTAIGNYIRGSIHRLNSDHYQIADIIQAMRLAAEQSERAGEIIHRIKNFIRKGQLYFETVDINELVGSIVMLLKAELADLQIETVYELEPDLPKLTADKLQIEQVMINVIRNSLEAMRDAQTISPKITIRTVLLHKQAIRVDIIDNGPGFSSNFNQAMEPYFSTKPYGMGLGLSICRTIIEAHGGQLLIKSPAVGGAWVQFTLSLQVNNVTE